MSRVEWTAGKLAAWVAIALIMLANAGGVAGQEPDTTITIYASGTALEFQPSRISAPSGTRLRIQFINEGTLPHNVVLVKNEDDIDALGEAAYRAQDTGYVPLEQRDKLIAWTDLAKPGETVEMVLDAPSPGEYFFVCLYPGHFSMMVGTLRIRS